MAQAMRATQNTAVKLTLAGGTWLGCANDSVDPAPKHIIEPLLQHVSVYRHIAKSMRSPSHRTALSIVKTNILELIRSRCAQLRQVKRAAQPPIAAHAQSQGTQQHNN
jgi:hypothetical protein